MGNADHMVNSSVVFTEILDYKLKKNVFFYLKAKFDVQFSKEKA